MELFHAKTINFLIASKQIFVHEDIILNNVPQENIAGH